MMGREKGYTLIELLVAVSIFALMMGLLFVGFQTMDKGIGENRNIQARNEQVRTLHHFLQQYLRSTVPVWQNQKKQKVLTFHGDRQNLMFTSSMPAHLGPGGLYEISLEVTQERSDEVVHLDFNRQLFNEDYRPEDDVLRNHARLLEGFQSIYFSYYGVDELSQESIWFDEWQGRKQLPDLIKVLVETENEQTELLIEPVIMVSRFTPLKPGDGVIEEQ